MDLKDFKKNKLDKSKVMIEQIHQWLRDKRNL